jgi:hypothetical protein
LELNAVLKNLPTIAVCFIAASLIGTSCYLAVAGKSISEGLQGLTLSALGTLGGLAMPLDSFKKKIGEGRDQ